MDFARPLPIKTLNRVSPPYPATVIAFSRNVGNNAYDVYRFGDDYTFDRYRIMTVAVLRVLMHDDDLTDVPTGVLSKIHQQVFPGSAPVTERGELLTKLSLDAIKGIAIPYEERIMSDENSSTATAEPANSTEAKAAAKAAAAKAKQDAKDKAKADREEKRQDGVIGNIFKGLNSDAGVTVNEMLDRLVAKFPGRTRDGMSSTVKIQFSRLAKSKKREIINANIEGRGRVYKFADLGAVPGKVVVKEEAAPAPAADDANGTGPALVGDAAGDVASTEPAKGAGKPAAKSAAKTGKGGK